uniref:(California timema) hypothetical protein n=1 Tax=Timema californicum TaxID=61474 RepID=A0A7R9P715_TIMCA|nr:unnamed protein product [Timema californicum]
MNIVEVNAYCAGAAIVAGHQAASTSNQHSGSRDPLALPPGGGGGGGQVITLSQLHNYLPAAAPAPDNQQGHPVKTYVSSAGTPTVVSLQGLPGQFLQYFSRHPPVYEKDTKIFVWNCALHSDSDVVFDCCAHANIGAAWGGRWDCQVERALLLSQCRLWRDDSKYEKRKDSKHPTLGSALCDSSLEPHDVVRERGREWYVQGIWDMNVELYPCGWLGGGES